MRYRKRTFKDKESINARIYEDCLEIENGNSKKALLKYRRVMGKLKAQEKLDSEEDYLNLTTE